MGRIYYELSADKIDCLRNPTTEKAMKFWPHDLLGSPKTETAALAGVHKARLVWSGSTKKMIRESKKWLAENGYSPTPSPYAVREDSQ